MTTYFHRKVWIGFIVALSIITWLAVSAFIQNRKFTVNSQWVTHTNQVLFHAEQLLSLVIDLESGQRGYSLTGDEAFLEPTHFASRNLVSHVTTLIDLTRDNPYHQDRLSRLQVLVAEKLKFTKEVILQRRISFENARLSNASMKGKKLTDEIRSLMHEIEQRENDLLEQRTEVSDRGMIRFYNTFLSLLFATGIILLLVFYSIYVSLRARTKAEAALRIAMQQTQDMYDNAPCGYHSIDTAGVFLEINQTWLKWLQYKREEVLNKLTFNDIITEQSRDIFRQNFEKFKREGKISDVEYQMVRKDGSVFSVLLNALALYDDNGNFLKSRSTAIDYSTQRMAFTKIEQLNKELESFSYSVSHDMRAPLRSINGYTQILIEDYSANFDNEGRRLLNIVVTNARRMAQLIDDLLDFSRVSRKEFSKSHVSVEKLVQAIIAEFSNEISKRAVKIAIQDLKPCLADPSLLRQVWTNLISNAIKYTSKEEMAYITISSTIEGDELVYKIKDNGTGFDMLYSNKLFGVFQRLHRQQDFEGTGVGLAIVHRIISRHGGKVWADAKVNEGATFYFSLPKAVEESNGMTKKLVN